MLQPPVGFYKTVCHSKLTNLTALEIKRSQILFGDRKLYMAQLFLQPTCFLMTAAKHASTSQMMRVLMHPPLTNLQVTVCTQLSISASNCVAGISNNCICTCDLLESKDIGVFKSVCAFHVAVLVIQPLPWCIGQVKETQVKHKLLQASDTAMGNIVLLCCHLPQSCFTSNAISPVSQGTRVVCRCIHRKQSKPSLCCS